MLIWRCLTFYWTVIQAYKKLGLKPTTNTFISNHDKVCPFSALYCYQTGVEPQNCEWVSCGFRDGRTFCESVISYMEITYNKSFIVGVARGFDRSRFERNRHFNNGFYYQLGLFVGLLLRRNLDKKYGKLHGF